ncbi:pyroglutamyl-peptidase I [Paenibacillus hodogayensis]|uniref:Pyrrolidone-carboxylate peptidase n=1 Tax=Paenibacillus hodogayensis TaxID=279208 RepID=A0ABV5VPG4_9BACL
MSKVLVTGFEPFGGDRTNAAWEAVKRLSDFKPIGAEITVMQIPTVFGRSVEALKQAIRDHRPDVVICIGQASGRKEITPERVAINIDDARIPDNDGQSPIDEPIVPEGPAAYWSTLPIKAVVREMRASGIAAAVSNSAGTFVCNHVFYGLAHLIATECPRMRGGFIHVPLIPEQAEAGRDLPNMPLESIVRGLAIAIETTVNVERDIAETGGREC